MGSGAAGTGRPPEPGTLSVTPGAYRDIRLIPIGGGTSEVMKEIIWKWVEMGG